MGVSSLSSFSGGVFFVLMHLSYKLVRHLLSLCMITMHMYFNIEQHNSTKPADGSSTIYTNTN